MTGVPGWGWFARAAAEVTAVRTAPAPVQPLSVAVLPYEMTARCDQCDYRDATWRFRPLSQTDAASGTAYRVECSACDQGAA